MFVFFALILTERGAEVLFRILVLCSLHMLNVQNVAVQIAEAYGKEWGGGFLYMPM